MQSVTKHIEVEVPVSVAYNQWTQFESFPEFMSGVEEVRQIDDTTLHFTTKIGGVKREYDARITEQVPDSVISWVSTDEPRNAGTVRFEPLGPDRADVTVKLDWHPETFVEKAGAALSADEMQVAADLDKFKKFIEERGQETGAWRGTVTWGTVTDEDITVDDTAVNVDDDPTMRRTDGI